MREVPPVLIACAGCDAVLRVPRERMSEAPRCPRCHTPVFPGKPLELEASSFDRHLMRSELPLIVDFWAPWCAPCRMMAPHFEATARMFERQARFAKVNSDEERALSSRFDIRGIPTLIAWRDGRELSRQSGALDADRLQDWVRAAIGAP